MEKIYFDNASTTKVDLSVLEKMLPYYEDYYGNASSSHSIGFNTRVTIEDVRAEIARCLHCNAHNIYFTSGGTESNNWAILGTVRKNNSKHGHIITSSIEHPSIINVCKYLETVGYDVTYLPVNHDGIISLNDLEASLREDTCLISIMAVNNELGSIQPIKEIGEIAKKNNIYFHTDAVQLFGYAPIDVSDINIDLMSMSGHKLHGPKGIGILYIKDGVNISPLLFGGGQEREMRAGTENVAGIVGVGTAISKLTEDYPTIQKHIDCLRNTLIDGLSASISGIHFNGDTAKQQANIISITVNGVPANFLVQLMDKKGIAISSGAACSCKKQAPSHVLTAIGLTDDEARNTIRISLSKNNTIDEIQKFISVFQSEVTAIRTA